MSRRRPLPHALGPEHLTRAQAIMHGVPDSRLRGKDLKRVSHGLYRIGEPGRGGWSELGILEPGHGFAPSAVAALAEVTGSAVSHGSAALLYGIPVRPQIQDEQRLHLTSLSPGRRPQRKNIAGHRRPLPERQVTQRFGIRTVTAERAWLDLASVLGPERLDDLVVAGDYLVHHPWTAGRRRDPVSTPERMQQLLDEVGQLAGVGLARSALSLVRVGSDSRPETLLRLELSRAGLPEPSLQYVPEHGAPYPADLAYPAWKIVLQYDGGHHLTREQQARDARRDAWFQALGWSVIRVTADDIANGFRRVIRLIHELRTA